VQKLFNLYLRFERFLGNVRFAVIIILIFALYLAIGTFQESYYGADYANRLIYKSTPFMLVQLFMFLSIYFATAQRFPYRKKLAGFYVLHLGLLLIFAGSVITYIAGVDGNMTLYPNSPTKKITLPKELLLVEWEGKNYEYPLPFSAGPAELKLDFQGLKINTYLPFADEKKVWQSINQEAPSTEYTLANDMVAESLLFSHVPELALESTKSLGPLNVHYLNESLFTCFKLNNPSGLILWDLVEGRCFSPEEVQANLLNDELKLSYQEENYIFQPKISPNPVNFQGNINQARLTTIKKIKNGLAIALTKVKSWSFLGWAFKYN